MTKPTQTCAPSQKRKLDEADSDGSIPMDNRNAEAARASPIPENVNSPMRKQATGSSPTHSTQSKTEEIEDNLEETEEIRQDGLETSLEESGMNMGPDPVRSPLRDYFGSDSDELAKNSVGNESNSEDSVSATLDVSVDYCEVLSDSNFNGRAFNEDFGKLDNICSRTLDEERVIDIVVFEKLNLVAFSRKRGLLHAVTHLEPNVPAVIIEFYSN